jgi:hypothetical protein
MIFDFLWTMFLLAGIEHIRLKPGIIIASRTRAVDVVEATQIAYSHSLLTGAIWAALFAAAYFLRRRYALGAWVIFAAVLSHWLLDFISHPPDMPLAPGAGRSFGLGLWKSIPATLLLEGLLWVVAVVVYVRATRARKRAGSYALWIGLAVLSAAWLNNILAPPPAELSVVGISSLIFFCLTVAWAYWIDRARLLATKNT